MTHQKVAVFDFDGVLMEYHGFGDGSLGPPNRMGLELANRMYELGFKIVVQTCRTNPRWGYNSHKQYIMIYEWLQDYDVPFYDLVYEGKAIADVYFDDRAVHIPKNFEDFEDTVYLHALPEDATKEDLLEYIVEEAYMIAYKSSKNNQSPAPTAIKDDTE